jgi:hypothetical protein
MYEKEKFWKYVNDADYRNICQTDGHNLWPYQKWEATAESHFMCGFGEVTENASLCTSFTY